MTNQSIFLTRYVLRGDSASGHDTFDDIITQMMNQIEATGPPPMAKEKIARIPTVSIDRQQVG